MRGSRSVVAGGGLTRGHEAKLGSHLDFGDRFTGAYRCQNFEWYALSGCSIVYLTSVRYTAFLVGFIILIKVLVIL